MLFTLSPSRRVLIGIALILAGAWTAAAQEIPQSFYQLQVLVKPGDAVRVTDIAGHVVGAVAGGCNGLPAACVAIYGAFGSGIGAAVDAVIQREQVIYARTPMSAAQVMFWPVLTSERRGLLVSLQFTKQR